jgi:hypothetical protein
MMGLAVMGLYEKNRCLRVSGFFIWHTGKKEKIKMVGNVQGLSADQPGFQMKFKKFLSFDVPMIPSDILYTLRRQVFLKSGQVVHGRFPKSLRFLSEIWLRSYARGCIKSHLAATAAK